MSDYHIPVLLTESIDNLVWNADGLYIDITYGGGGHSKEILNKLSDKGRLIVFDQDEEAEANLIDDQRISFVKSNFRYLHRYWKWMGLEQVDGVFGDLGVSSHQFDVEYRGFSYRFDAALDMRMNESAERTAEWILNEYGMADLKAMFSEYGEVRNATKLSATIIDHRKSGRPLRSTADLNAVLDSVLFGDKMKYYSQVYQALRIEVNDEMGALKEVLTDSLKILKQNGKLIVISYHSLEDRIVKRFMKTGNVEGVLKKDDYGRSLAEIKMDKKLILPSEEEQEINIRSRSAKMRVGTKL